MNRLKNFALAVIVLFFAGVGISSPSYATPLWVDELHVIQMDSTNVQHGILKNDGTYETNNLLPTNSFSKVSASIRGLAYRSSDESAFAIGGDRTNENGCTSSGTPGDLYDVQSSNFIHYIATLSITDICFARNIAIDNSGQAYVIGFDAADIWKVWKLDLTTGAVTDAKTISVSSPNINLISYVNGLVFNPSDGFMYVVIDDNSCCSTKSGIFKLSLANGSTQLIAEKTGAGPTWRDFTFDSHGNIYAYVGSTLWYSTFDSFKNSQTFTTNISYSAIGVFLSAGPMYFIPIVDNGGGTGGGTGGGGTGGGGTGGGTGSGNSGGTNNLAPGELGTLGVNPPTDPPAQGDSSTTIGGSEVKTNTSSNDKSDSVTSSNGGKYSSSVTFKDFDGDAVVPLTSNETIGVEPGSDLSITGKGFKSKSQVQVYLIDANGKSIYLGKINTSIFGRLKGKLSVPADIAGGKYTLQLNGYTKKKNLVKSTNLGMEVVQDDIGSLFFTSDSAKATEETKAMIKEMAKSLDAGESVILYGYTAGNPDSMYKVANFKLAKRRAETIKALFEAEGVKASIILEPQGAVSPYGSGGGNAKNRRVDVKPAS